MFSQKKKQLLFKTTDWLSSVLTSVTTAIFLSALIFLVLAERLGETTVIATLKNSFPSKELDSIMILLIALFVLGAITMWSFSDNKLSFLCVSYAVVTVIVTVFFLCFTKLYIFIFVLAVCILFLCISILRLVLLLKKFDEELQENNQNY